MSAVLQTPTPRLRAMTPQDLDAVMALEQSVYSFAWSRGNFSDSLQAGYWMHTLTCGDALVGYGVMQRGVGESHLLNITVAPDWQGQGHGLMLLDAMTAHARERGDAQLWLEVRPSNSRALAVYARYGFVQVGQRRGYYPAAGSRREDALVLRLDLNGGQHALE
jgi:[ribosomal protein S18]-alanine N-acetyltransferase